MIGGSVARMATRGWCSSAGLAVLLCGFGVPALSQAPEAGSEAEAAAINMRLAATICLRHVRTPSELQAAYTEAGFAVEPYIDPGSFNATAPGVGVLFGGTGGPQGFCKVESVLVDLAMARAIGDAIVAEYPEGAFTPGWPGETQSAPPPLCQGYVAWDARPIITLVYTAAGNSGECIDDGTSSIFID